MINIYSNFNKAQAKSRLEAEAKAAPPEYGFTDRFTAARKAAYTVGTEFGRRESFNDLMAQQSKIIEDNKLDLFIPGSLQKINHGRAVSSPALLEKIKENREKFNQIRAERPDLGLKTVDELEQAQLNDFSNIMQANQRAADNSTMMGYVGSFLGSAAGYIQDPVGAATLFFPAARVTQGMKALTAVREGAKAELKAAAIPIGVNKPGELAVRQELGEEITPQQVLGEVGVELGAAALLGGAAGGLTAGLRSAIHVDEAVSHMENAVPPGTTKEQHTENLNKMLNDHADGKDVTINEVDPPINPIEPIKTESEDVILNQQDLATTNLFDDPEADIQFKQEYNEILSDEDVYTKLIECMRKHADGD